MFYLIIRLNFQIIIQNSYAIEEDEDEDDDKENEDDGSNNKKRNQVLIL
jgi:hypothetical protein